MNSSMKIALGEREVVEKIFTLVVTNVCSDDEGVVF